MKRPNSKSLNIRAGTGQCGYMLITLMLALALISIGLLAVLPEIGQQIRRDREEEMRNRGTAYMRAIQHFYKKFGRYPTRIEELENTNNLRFLRKRYTDPLNRDPQTGKEKEFKILHQQDVNLNNSPLAGMMPGQQGGLGQVGGAAGIQQNAIANALGRVGTSRRITDRRRHGDSNSRDQQFRRFRRPRHAGRPKRRRFDRIFQSRFCARFSISFWSQWANFRGRTNHRGRQYEQGKEHSRF